MTEKINNNGEAKDPNRLTNEFEKYAKYLPVSDDITLIILKGHLIVEELLNDICLQHCFNPDSLGKARLTFIQRAYIAQALLRMPATASWWEPVFHLNKIRNSLMHHLEPRDIENQVLSMHRLCKLKPSDLPDKWKEPQSISEITRYCVTFVWGQMSALKDVAHVLNKFPTFEAAQRTVEEAPK